MSFCAVILALWPFEVASLILPATKANLPALALAVTFLHVAAAFQLFDGVQVAAALSLRGLKDARAPMWIAGASYWLAGFPVCIFLGFGLGLQGFGIWIGLAFGLLVAAVLAMLAVLVHVAGPVGCGVSVGGFGQKRRHLSARCPEPLLVSS